MIHESHRITVDEVIEYLSARSIVPSPMGAMTARLRDGMSGSTGDIYSVLERMEIKNMHGAIVLRCVSDLLEQETLGDGALRWLSAAAKKHGLREGYVVVAVMRVYQEWIHVSELRALAEVHCWREAANAVEVTDAFCEDKMRAEQSRAQGLVTDCRAALANWVRDWDRN